MHIAHGANSVWGQHSIHGVARPQANPRRENQADAPNQNSDKDEANQTRGETQALDVVTGAEAS